jgi:hypothetical protein
MGQLLGKQITQTRIYYEEEVTPIPDLDYDYAYPITVYDAVKRSMDDDATTLTDEIASIYSLINEKQPIIEAGTAGRIMTWSGVRGQVGEMEVVQAIASEKINQSRGKVPSERAVADSLATKVNSSIFYKHADDTDIHVTEDEKEKWNAMAPSTDLTSHTSNDEIHLTAEERTNWNAKADQSAFEEHLADTNNPHNVTAHQAGTYSRREIDQMFEDLRETFFHYVNISWDSRNNIASLVDYNAALWNPNFILSYGVELPDVADPSATYFALIPATDYSSNETQDCIIYVKLPGLTWQEVGLQSMEPGDMVIMYPSATMYVWIQGHFQQLFTMSEVNASDSDITETPSTGTSSSVTYVSTKLWKPVQNEDGSLGWELATSDDPPETMVIAGYTPVKGVDYFDGQDGVGVPTGGRTNEVLAKSSDKNYDTEWKDIYDVFKEFVEDGGSLPDGIVTWDAIKDHPKTYYTTGENEDGFMTQNAVTKELNSLQETIDTIEEQISNLGSVDGIRSSLNDHLNDTSNPHRVTAAQIGAVSNASFLAHAQSFNNPHAVTAAQLGLGNVNNTADVDKPISTQTQEALDDLLRKIQSLQTPGTTDNENIQFIENVVWNTDDNAIDFYQNDGTIISVTIPKSETTQPVFTQMYFNHETSEIVIQNPETGEEDSMKVADIIQYLTGSEGENVTTVVDEDGKIVVTLNDNSITGDKLVESIHLNGNPTAKTQDVTDNSTRLATTEFVRGQVIDNLISYETDRALSANMGRILNETKADTADILELIEDLNGIDIIDNLESSSTVAALSANMGRYLDLMKPPRVHTSPSGSTYGRATADLFGHVRISAIVPLMDGTASPGTDDGTVSRADHRHPTDFTRAPVNYPDTANGITKLTGEPKADTPPDDSNDERIATTEWVRRSAGVMMAGTCSTGANDPIKVCTLTSEYTDNPMFILQKGAGVVITFSETDAATDKTMLDVQGTGPAPVIFAGRPVSENMISANYSHMFIYEGEYWVLINPAALNDPSDDDVSNHIPTTEWVRRNASAVYKGTCNTGGAVCDKVATLRSTFMDPVVFIRQIGSTVAVTFANEDRSGDDITTLNVNGTGAAAIMYAGGAVTNCMLGKSHTHLFVYDGTYWNLINPVPGTGIGGATGITLGPGAQTDDEDTELDPDSDDTIVDQMSGYTGITTQSGATVDDNGQVDIVWVAINFENRATVPSVTLSRERNAWAVKMGNGSLIVCSDPKVLTVTTSSAMIQFTLKKAYPSNSPCQLIYHTDKAWLNIK